MLKPKPMFYQVLKITKPCLTFILLFVCAFFLGCVSSKDYYQLPAMVSENSFNAVIEIPAGTNKKYEYHPIQKQFLMDRENGKQRVINFLPYPGNYGFIPSTLSKLDSGGDGDALDVLVIAEALPTGTVIETLPIALLKLIDDGEIDYKVIAVPTAKKDRIINATNYENLVVDYPNLIQIVELWFLNYNKNDTSSVEGWGDEQEAFEEIKNHLKKEKQ